MKYDSVLELKNVLLDRRFDAYLGPIISIARKSKLARKLNFHLSNLPVAIGVTRKKKEFLLAVRFQELLPGIELFLSKIRDLAKHECEIKLVVLNSVYSIFLFGESMIKNPLCSLVRCR